MTRVLHVLASLSQTYGGPLRAVVDLSAQSAALGIESEIAGFGPLDLPDNPFDQSRIHSFSIAAPRKYVYSPQFRTWLHTNLRRFDGVVLHGLWIYPNWAVSQECLAQRVPYACFLHGMLEPWTAYGLNLWKTLQKAVCWNVRERRILRNARCLFYSTHREHSVAEKTFRLTGYGRIVPPYGMQVRTVRVLSPGNSTLALPQDWRIALFLGRLHPKKNVDFLIKTWKAARLPDAWHLVIAGTGDTAYENSLRNFVQRAGLGTHVHFAGFVAGYDKSYLLQRAAWFLLPSMRENFGVAVLEAISHGCPVAISDQVYIAESLHPRSEVLPLDMQAWTTFMSDRMVDDGWRNAIASMDAASLIESHSMEAVTKKWAAALTETFARDDSPLPS